MLNYKDALSKYSKDGAIASAIFVSFLAFVYYTVGIAAMIFAVLFFVLWIFFGYVFLNVAITDGKIGDEK